MPADDTHIRALLRQHGYPSYAALARCLPDDARDGDLDDKLRKARRQQDLPPLNVMRGMAAAMGISWLMVLQAAVADVDKARDATVGIEELLAAELMAKVPRTHQMRVYQVMVQVVDLIDEPAVTRRGRRGPV